GPSPPKLLDQHRPRGRPFQLAVVLRRTIGVRVFVTVRVGTVIDGREVVETNRLMCEFVDRGSPDALAYSIDDLTPRGTCRRVLDRVVRENRARPGTRAPARAAHAPL